MRHLNELFRSYSIIYINEVVILRTSDLHAQAVRLCFLLENWSLLDSLSAKLLDSRLIVSMRKNA